jgi:hypothetical protein
MNDNYPLMVPESIEPKAYTAPAIVHELKLETRAGSPIGGGGGFPPGLLDPLGLDPTQPKRE